MTATETAAPAVAPFAAALTAFAAFLTAHPDLPALTDIGLVSDEDGSITVYPRHTKETREPSLARVEQHTAVWAEALGTTAQEPYTHMTTNGTYVACHAEALITPDVRVYAVFTADADPVEPVPAAEQAAT